MDTAELARVYDDLNVSEPFQINGNASADILAVKDNQIADLRNQLEKSEMRETALTDERSKLLDLLSAEKENVRALLPPADDRKSNWWHRLVGVR